MIFRIVLNSFFPWGILWISSYLLTNLQDTSIFITIRCALNNSSDTYTQPRSERSIKDDSVSNNSEQIKGKVNKSFIRNLHCHILETPPERCSTIRYPISYIYVSISALTEKRYSRLFGKLLLKTIKNCSYYSPMLNWRTIGGTIEINE